MSDQMLGELESSDHINMGCGRVVVSVQLTYAAVIYMTSLSSERIAVYPHKTLQGLHKQHVHASHSL